MLKDGRPYTIEDDQYADIMLLSNCSTAEIRSIDSWIRNNIRKGDTLSSHTSYTLKHLLQQDISVYLTNNQFKDAMLLAGYLPEDPSEINWRYRIIFLRDVNGNPNPFLQWANDHTKGLTFWEVFVRSLRYDSEFPIFAEYHIMSNYLKESGARPEEMDMFQKLWKEYSSKKYR